MNYQRNESRSCGCHVFHETIGRTKWNRLDFCVLHASAPMLRTALEEASRALTLLDPLGESHDAELIDKALGRHVEPAGNLGYEEEA